MSDWLRMIGAMLAPVVLAIGFYLLDSKTGFRKLSVLLKQIIIGIAFGILACLATQYGIPYENYVLNVRSATPLTAGLVFGGPAGIIAGVMGALYRWFYVLWGGGAYTQVACSVATLLAGIIGTLCRKYMFSNKKTSWFYGFFIAMITEVIHMLLVFITHMNDIKTAFEVVKMTAIPMILANSVSLWLTLFIVALIGKEKFRVKKYSRPITQTFSVYLLICVVLSFLATSFFTGFLQQNISDMEVEHTLSLNVSDIESGIKAAIDKDLLEKTRTIAAKAYKGDIPANAIETFRTYLLDWMETYDVSEINLVNSQGVISVSTTEQNDGFSLNTTGQAGEFMCLLDDKEFYVQDYQPIDKDNSVSRKYAGVALKGGGFIQVGYDFEHFQDSVLAELSDAATYRHIGQEGFVFILSGVDGSVISATEGTMTNEEGARIVDELSALEDNKVCMMNSNEGIEYCLLKTNVEGYIVVGCIPSSETTFSRDISVYISALMQLVVFFALFVVVFFLLKTIIVDNIHKINTSLAKITGGDLSTKIDIEENEEFSSLSHDINATVERLKEFITEAEKRIDKELSYAKDIQHSVLPSVFPPYPNRREFDIYARMETAKEVGGDFYDFYLLGSNRLIFLVADVSGKGIPAAMFMMNAKSVIKSLTESGLGVADVFSAANQKLCESNETGMFVTAWMGILDLTTGVVHFANAGHNPPVIRHKNGEFELYKSRPNLVLAGMEGLRYREGEFTLSPGDEIFLYTDGVTEATNSETQLFGEERLLETLNKKPYLEAKEVCQGVMSAIDEFVGDEPRFDDITMLSLKYKGQPDDFKEIVLPAAVDSIEQATEFVDKELEAHDASPKSEMQINVAIDEIFANISSYAYPDGEGKAVIGILVKDGVATLRFTDAGVPFNPLKKDDPDVTKSADERAIGGLGIFMVKKTMDSVEYEYVDGKNVLTLKKTI